MSLSVSSENKAPFSELTLGLPDGTRIAVKQWGHEHSENRLLCLHGWLDNAATWDVLAPMLVRKLSVRLVCVDLSGHGRSSHQHHASAYYLPQRVIEVLDVADVLGWTTFALMGHSMGAGIATLVAGTAPDRVTRLILVDGMGPWPSRMSASRRLATAVKQAPKIRKRHRRIYPSRAAAVERYMKNNPGLSEHAASLLIARGTQKVEMWEKAKQDRDTSREVAGEVEEGFAFRHDVRLTALSTTAYTEPDVDDFLRNIKCPVLLILADNEERRQKAKQPDDISHVFKRRIGQVSDIAVLVVEGHHHLHLDQAHAIDEPIAQFLRHANLQPKQQQQRQPLASDGKAGPAIRSAL